MRAVQITRFGGPEVLEVVDLPEPEAGDGQKLYDVSTAGINYADTHHPVSADSPGAPASRLHPGAEQNGPAVPPARPGHVHALCTGEETPAGVAVFCPRAGHRGRHT
jgi:NADPH:quinone reductase-like Zn-dependent oxidoreductase